MWATRYSCSADFLRVATLKLTSRLPGLATSAAMPGALVRDGRGLDVEAFLVEMRSLSGFSGSPVFVYMGPGTYRGNSTMMPFYSETIGLMGIDTGHKASIAPIEHRASGPETDLVVRLNTGISIVAPIWRVAEAIDMAAKE